MNCYSSKKLITDDNIIYKSPDKPYKCCKYCREKRVKYYKFTNFLKWPQALKDCPISFRSVNDEHQPVSSPPNRRGHHAWRHSPDFYWER